MKTNDSGKTVFEVGDVVQLKSGGPPMTVETVEWNKDKVIVYVVYFSNGIFCYDKLRSECIVLCGVYMFT